MSKRDAVKQVFYLLVFSAVLLAVAYFLFRPTQPSGLQPSNAALIRTCENAQIASEECFEEGVWNKDALAALPQGCGELLKKQVLREITCPDPQQPDYCTCGKPPV
ncbi:MAG: hypothetical protein V1834_02865 [Candidatus Micrarchaeota archaeon]